MDKLYTVTLSEEYLKHHGILGQKWGERNGPPYPLDYKTHNEVVKESKSSSNKRLKLTDNQKKWIKRGAIATGALLATAGTIYLAKSGKLQTIGNQFVNGKGSLFNLSKNMAFDDDASIYTSLHMSSEDSITAELLGLNKIKEPERIYDTLKKVNPNFNNHNIFDDKFVGSRLNCGNCVITAEMRMRGIDAEAKLNFEGMRISHIGEMFDGLNSDSFIQFGHMEGLESPKYSKLIGKLVMKNANIRSSFVKNKIQTDIITKYQDDARGALFVPMSTGSHWIYWTKTRNKVNFYDPQNTKQKIDKLFSKFYYHRNSADAECTSIRLDNLSITPNVTELIMNVGDKDDMIGFNANMITGEDFRFLLY